MRQGFLRGGSPPTALSVRSGREHFVEMTTPSRVPTGTEFGDYHQNQLYRTNFFCVRVTAD